MLSLGLGAFGLRMIACANIDKQKDVHGSSLRVG